MSVQNPSQSPGARSAGNVIDFDEAMLDACSPEEKSDLLAEADMLARAFAPERRGEHLQALAATLCAGARDQEMGRVHARKLAAALRRLGRQAGDLN